MFTLAMVILSAFSTAISSSTGATILHGPHHSAQKSTRTGLSLPRTSVSNVASVTVLVAAPMSAPSGSMLRVTVKPRRWLRHSRASLDRGEPPLCVERSLAAGAGRGDGLAVDVVDQVAAGEDAVEVGPGRGCVDEHVTLVVEGHLTADELAARVVPDRHEQPGDVECRAFAGHR